MELDLPAGYTSRPFRGPDDFVPMTRALAAVRRHAGDNELPTPEIIAVTYASFSPADCVPTRDVALMLDPDGEVVGYARAAREAYENGDVTWLCFPVVHPDHLDEALFAATVRSLERHLGEVALEGDRPQWYASVAPHPGPDLPATGRAAWLESMGYTAVQYGAALVRPHLDDIPDLALPDGLELRPVRPEHLREIWEVHQEAFRGQWDFREPTEEDYRRFLDDPLNDTTLWKIAWDERGVVGQVKSFINADENDSEGRRRGYTEFISTRADWRNRGIAAALLCASLRELRDRGMTEAALGADVNNPSAFLLYQRLGFEVRLIEAFYRRPID